MTYYEESLAVMDKTFVAFDSQINESKKRWKTLHEKIYCMLRPAHGHPLNVGRLEGIVNNFIQVHSECSNELTNACTGTHVSDIYVLCGGGSINFTRLVYNPYSFSIITSAVGVQTILKNAVENHQKNFPDHLFKAITLSIHSLASLKTVIDHIIMKPVDHSRSLSIIVDRVLITIFVL